jgi:hypothetical protein
MSAKTAQSANFTDTKKHYPILDGLRGVAAIFITSCYCLNWRTCVLCSRCLAMRQIL